MDRLTAMTTFVRVIESGSFSRAARQLGVGQPAVSKTVATLEAELGVRLVLRSTRRLTATDAGRAFYDGAVRALEAVHEAEELTRAAGSRLAGRLRISAPVTFARLHLVPRLGPFLDRHPELTVDVVLSDRALDLVSNNIDLALRVGELPDSRMTARPLARSPRGIFAAPSYLRRAGTPSTLADLLGHATIVYGDDPAASRWVYLHGARERVFEVRPRLRLTAAEGVREAVRAGLGVALGSEWMFAPELASGTVVRVLEHLSLPGSTLWAVSAAGRRPSARARAFLAFVESLLAPRRASLPPPVSGSSR